MTDRSVDLPAPLAPTSPITHRPADRGRRRRGPDARRTTWRDHALWIMNASPGADDQDDEGEPTEELADDDGQMLSASRACANTARPTMSTSMATQPTWVR